MCDLVVFFNYENVSFQLFIYIFFFTEIGELRIMIFFNIKGFDLKIIN